MTATRSLRPVESATNVAKQATLLAHVLKLAKFKVKRDTAMAAMAEVPTVAAAMGVAVVTVAVAGSVVTVIETPPRTATHAAVLAISRPCARTQLVVAASAGAVLLVEITLENPKNATTAERRDTSRRCAPKPGKRKLATTVVRKDISLGIAPMALRMTLLLPE